MSGRCCVRVQTTLGICVHYRQKFCRRRCCHDIGIVISLHLRVILQKLNNVCLVIWNLYTSNVCCTLLYIRMYMLYMPILSQSPGVGQRTQIPLYILYGLYIHCIYPLSS